MIEFSCSVEVGQACTQAPHETHSDCMNGWSCPGDTRDSKPRPEIRQREGALDLPAGAHATARPLIELPGDAPGPSTLGA